MKHKKARPGFELGSSVNLTPYIYTYIYIYVCVCVRVIQSTNCRVGKGCRIHQLHLYSGVRSPATTTSLLDMMMRPSSGALENVMYPFIAITPMSTLALPIRVSSIGQIKLFDHLAECKQINDIKSNCLHFIAIHATI